MEPALLTEAIARNCSQLVATDYSEKMVEQAMMKRIEHILSNRGLLLPIIQLLCGRIFR